MYQTLWKVPNYIILLSSHNSIEGIIMPMLYKKKLKLDRLSNFLKITQLITFCKTRFWTRAIWLWILHLDK